jgi:CSLREA domain-containing protein
MRAMGNVGSSGSAAAPDRWYPSRLVRSVVLAAAVCVGCLWAPAVTGSAWANAARETAAAVGSGRFTEQQKIVPGDESGSESNPGSSVAVSANGSTMLIGASFDVDAKPGAVWVYARSGSSWQEQAKLIPGDAGPYGFPEFGTSVALSADGNTAVIGAPYDNTLGSSGSGAIWVYVRSGSTWSEQAKIVPADAEPSYGEGGVGLSVAISADGNTVLTAEDGNTIDSGLANAKAWVYTRSGSTWTEQQELDLAGYSLEPYSVALSGDGSTAMIGTPETGVSPAQAVWVYSRTGSTWTQQQEIVPTDASSREGFGSSVSLSSDGDEAVIGDQSEGTTGAAWMYTRSTTGWSEQQKLVPSDEGSTSDGFGDAVSISGDGNTAAIGGTDDTGRDQGAAWVYASSGGNWTEEQKISPADAGSTTQIGASVALSSDASTVVVGAPDDEYGDAAAWVYTAPALVVTSTGDQDDTATDLASGVCNVNLTGPQACTLRAAIEVANQRAGGTITFDIPSGPGSGNTFDPADPSVPEITPASNLPDVTATTTIDGTTQPGSGLVELDGSGDPAAAATNRFFPAGLSLSADGSLVKGLVINRFAVGIYLASRSTVQGDLIGTDPTGTIAEPTTDDSATQYAGITVDTGGSGSQIGGPGQGQGNIISGNTGAGVLLSAHDAPTSVAIQGNTIGPARDGSSLLTPGSEQVINTPTGDCKDVQAVALAVTAPEGVCPVTDEPVNYTEPWSLGGAETIGGTAGGAGNQFAGRVYLLNAGPGSGDVVQGNTFESTSVIVVGTDTIGGPSTTKGVAPGNEFIDTSLAVDNESGAVVQGNRFRGNPQGAFIFLSDTPDYYNVRGLTDIGPGDPVGPVTIGGEAAADGNQIGPASAKGAGIEICGCADGASLGFLADNIVENNSITGAQAGVLVYSSAGNRIVENGITRTPLGIGLGTTVYRFNTTPKPLTVVLHNPNDYEDYPVLLSSGGRDGATVTGKIEQPGTVRIDFYGSNDCRNSQGNTWLGSETISSLRGEKEFTARLARSRGAGQDSITATATGSDGSTSEFSPCLEVDHRAPSLASAGVTPAGTPIPVTPTGSKAGVPVPARAKRKTGHGTLWIQCPALTVGACIGTVTLRSTGKHGLRLLHRRYRIKPAFGASFAFTVPAKPYAQLAKRGKLVTSFTSTAHDRAKRRHHKTHHAKLTLVYEPAA